MYSRTHRSMSEPVWAQ